MLLRVGVRVGVGVVIGVVVERLVRLLISFLTHADGLHSSPLVGYLVDVLVRVVVGVGVVV